MEIAKNPSAACRATGSVEHYCCEAKHVLMSVRDWERTIPAHRLNPEINSMNRRIVTAIFALSTVLAISALAHAQSITDQQAGLTNPGFEEPRGKEASVVLVETMPGWKTTDSHFEIWGTGFKEVPAHEGTQFAELNAYINGTLYQDSTGIQRGSVLEFTFAHRGRSGEDTMQLTITDLGADNALDGGDDTVLFTNQYTTGKDAWAVYTSTTEQKIKALGNTVRFAYGAISTATGELGEGNLLDAANFGVGVVRAEHQPTGLMRLQTFGISGENSENHYLGMRDDRLGIPDETNPGSGSISVLFIEMMEDGATLRTISAGQYVTARGKEIVLTDDVEPGSYWVIRDPLKKDLQVSDRWFSLESVNDPGRYLRHYGHLAFAHKEQELNSSEAEHFLADAAWRFVDTRDPQATSDTNSIGMEFNLIPAGTFMMGSPESEEGREDDESQHEVTITRDYYIGITEVTQSQWQQVMGTTPWKGQESVQEGKDNAASYISWNDAGEFCRKLSEQEGRTYRLPTEAEWEYACRGGTTTPCSFGDDASQLEQFAWYHGNNPNYASQVKQKRPNGFGLYDMHGNVWELCQDWLGKYPQGSITDPTGPSSGAYRIMRGASFAGKAPTFRSAYRSTRKDLAEQLAVIGLRVVQVPGSDSGQLALNETPPENAMKLDVDGGPFTFGYRTIDQPGFTEFPNTDSPHPGITRRNITDGDYFSYAQNTRETEFKAQETDLVLYPAKAEGSGVLHPGKNPGDVAIARFTAMDDGEYHFRISAELIEENPTGAGVTIYVDDQVVETTQLNEHLIPWTTSFQRKLTIGQTVDIAVDYGVDENWEKDHILLTAKAWMTSPSIDTVTMVTAGDSETNEADAAEHILTRDLEDQKGAVWMERKIDFHEDFTISAEIYLGTKDDGADGLALVFQAEGNHIVSDGGGLGYQGISPSIVIEFDTYHNGDRTPKQAVNVNNNDPVEDHVGIRADGDPVHTASDSVEVGNLEDGEYHPITFEWNASQQTFNLSLDGEQIFKERSIPENGLAGQQVYFGFTAATGGLSNEHKVRSISFSKR